MHGLLYDKLSHTANQFIWKLKYEIIFSVCLYGNQIGRLPHLWINLKWGKWNPWARLTQPYSADSLWFWPGISLLWMDLNVYFFLLLDDDSESRIYIIVLQQRFITSPGVLIVLTSNCIIKPIELNEQKGIYNGIERTRTNHL